MGIGGFIVTGTQPKKVIVRAIGPSLPLPGKLANPSLGLYGPGGVLIASNDNWRSSQEAEIIATGLQPTNDLESAIVATLPASPDGIGYTAIMSGVNSTTGLGLVEVYDLDSTADSKLANISTRGQVLTDDDVMIGGVIVVGADSAKSDRARDWSIVRQRGRDGCAAGSDPGIARQQRRPHRLR